MREKEIFKLKDQAGRDILIAGSGTLAQSLMEDNIIDEYRLLVYPVVPGSGKRLFSSGINKSLKLVETRRFGSGVVGLHYQPAQISK